MRTRWRVATWATSTRRSTRSRRAPGRRLSTTSFRATTTSPRSAARGTTPVRGGIRSPGSARRTRRTCCLGSASKSQRRVLSTTEGPPQGGPSRLVGVRAAAGLGRMSLLVGAVARADERAREDRAEAQGLALLAEPAELVGMDPAVDRGVLRARLEVLADRDDVDAVLPQVAHRLHHL